MNMRMVVIGLSLSTLVFSGCGKKDGASGGGGGSGSPSGNPPASLSLLSQADASKCKVTFDLGAGNMQEVSVASIKAALPNGALQLRELEGYTWGKLRDPKDGAVFTGVAHIYSAMTYDAGALDIAAAKTEERCTDDSQLNTKMSVEFPAEVLFPSGDAAELVRLERIDNWRLTTQVRLTAAKAGSNILKKDEKPEVSEPGVEVTTKYYLRTDGKYETRFMVTSQKSEADMVIIGRGLYEFVPGVKKVQEGSKKYLDVYKDAYAFAASDKGLYFDNSSARNFADKVAKRTNGAAYLSAYKSAYYFATSDKGLYFDNSSARGFADKVAKRSDAVEYLSVYKEAYAFATSDKGLYFDNSSSRGFAEKVASHPKRRIYLKTYREAYVYASSSTGLNLDNSSSREFAEKSALAAVTE